MQSISRTSLPLSSLLDRSRASIQERSVAVTGLSQHAGHRLSYRRGHGVDFDDLRPYSYGDDIRHLDWNATARANSPYTRLFRDDRARTTSVALDFRPCMFSGSQYLKSVLAGLLAARILWIASRGGDRCSAITYSASGIQITKPRLGSAGVVRACELIAREFESAEQDSTLPSPKLGHWFDWHHHKTINRGATFLISDFYDADEDWYDIPLFNRRERPLVAIPVYDPIEFEGVSRGTYVYQSKSRARSVIVGRNSTREMKLNLVHAREKLNSVLMKKRISYVEALDWNGPEDVPSALMKYGYL